MTDAAARPETRGSYRWWMSIQTRWMDMDAYGHVNNVEYYSFFDSAVNKHLQDEAGLDPRTTQIIGLVIETKCVFKKSFVYPEVVEAGIRVARIGSSSVTYEIGLFREGDDEPAATGHFVHVYVDRPTQRPVPIPDGFRAAMEKIRA